MPARVRVCVVGAAGTLPSKCPKCTVDAVIVVEPQHAALARAAINKLRLKVKDERRVKLVLKSAVREHAAGTELPYEADLSEYLANDCVIAVSIHESPQAAAAHEPTPASAAATHEPAAPAVAAAGVAATAPGEVVPVCPLDVLVMPDVLGLLSRPLGVRSVFDLVGTCTALRAAVSECESGPWWREACEQWSPLLAALKAGAPGGVLWRELYLRHGAAAAQQWSDEDEFALLVEVLARVIRVGIRVRTRVICACRGVAIVVGVRVRVRVGLELGLEYGLLVELLRTSCRHQPPPPHPNHIRPHFHSHPQPPPHTHSLSPCAGDDRLRARPAEQGHVGCAPAAATGRHAARSRRG